MAVRNAWFSPATAAEVGARHSLGEVRIRQFWKEEKAAGRLPDSVRPHFADRCKKPEVVEPVEAIDAIDADLDLDLALAEPGDDDGLPIASPNPTHVHECDRLLAALQTHHGESWRALQTMPPHVLDMEVGNKARQLPPAPPSPRRVREFARVADVYTRVLLKRRAVAA